MGFGMIQKNHKRVSFIQYETKSKGAGGWHFGMSHPVTNTWTKLGKKERKKARKRKEGMNESIVSYL